MIKKNIWLDWDEIVHDSPEQQARQQQAAGKENKPCAITMNVKTWPKIDDNTVVLSSATTYSAHFEDSGNTIHTTLKKCDCEDFKRRHLPCRHMYRLAMEIGAFPKVNTSSHS